MNIKQLSGKYLFLFCLSTVFLFKIQAISFPEITELNSRNYLFAQYQEEIEQSNMATAAGKEPFLNFYTYTVKEGETLFSICSRCCMIYDTIATLNGIEESTQILTGKTLILPTVQGLYIPETPVTAIEILLDKDITSSGKKDSLKKIYVGQKIYYFLPGSRLNPTERSFFINTGMHLPLDQKVLTSSYGMRESPISGNWKFHHGIDMASPLGSNVYACKNGIVKKVGIMDPVYGNYIIISHSNGMESMYAHLNEVLVVKGKTVKTAEKIGTVGTTGASTGPHLHFEISIDGETLDPEEILK